MIDTRLLIDADNHLGEGPLWDVAEQRLYWIDSTAAEIASCRADGSDVRRYFVPRHIGSMALREQGGAVVSLANGLHFYDFEHQTVSLIADPEADEPETRFNDGKVDRRGRFVVGSMAYDFDRYEADRGQRPMRLGALYRLDPDGSVTTLDRAITCSNGPCWSPDNKTLYFTDTYDKQMYAYDYDIETGAVANRRVFASAHNMAGTFDGATVDAEGNYYAAMFEGAQVVKLSPAGEVLAEIPVPAQCPTMPCFGGDDLKTLYLTTARHNRPAAELEKYPLSGGLLSMQVDVPGLPVNFYRD